MGSETAPTLPIIDFSNVEEQWEEVKSQVYKALVEYGCFEALFSKVPLELRKAIFISLQELFDLPLHTKQRHVTSRPSHGYVEHSPKNQVSETFGIGDPNVYEEVERLTKVFWPQGNPDFSKTVESFSEQLSRLDHMIRKMILEDHMIRKMILESLGVEKYLEEQMSSTYYLLRTMKYLGPQTNEPKRGLVRHTDANILSFLCQNQVDGLEVQTKDGEWIKHKPSSSHSFFVVAGDALHAWSNGRIHASTQQVMMRGNETRYSLGLFTITKPGYIIKAPDELVDEEHPLLYKPYFHADFMKYLYNSEKAPNDYHLKVYCGVREM